MAGIELEKGKIICSEGQALTALHLITRGKVKVTYPGGEYTLGKGDCIGVCEICSEIHFLNYETVESTTLLSYPLTNMDYLNDLLQQNSDIAGLFIISAFNQINLLLNHCDTSEMICNNLYYDLNQDYKTYNALCSRYRIPARTLDGIENFNPFPGENTPDLWLHGYYVGVLRIFTSGHIKHYVQDSAVSLGTLRKASLDFRKTYLALEEQFNYRSSLNKYYLNQSGNDLFDFMTELYYKIGQDSSDANKLHDDITRIIQHCENTPCLDNGFVKQRTSSFRQNMEKLNKSTQQEDTSYEDIDLSELAGSLNIILGYAGDDLEIATSFREHIHSYKALEDKSSTSDEATLLRRRLTSEFYTLYSAVFEKTLSEPVIPLAVRLFLYFGYVDEELAGQKACASLCQVLSTMTGHAESGVYTFYDWLLAIYNGQKEPSRNEFDQDYFEYIHRQKASGNITDAELKELEHDSMNKVNYELQNMFVSANKVTYGRITTFCPIFIEEDCMKDLGSCYVTASAIGQAFENIKKIDYSAFYRETMDMEHLDIMGKELIHVEYLPDIILMPNIGIRGVMWQEIEGKRRTSPARMILSIFHLEDLNTNLIRLTGEYRWEMCKRVQGSRWNDISEPSLTSEYFDYIQFYRRNRDLTPEAKERIRQSLQRAKNSFKEMFVRDYITWVLFEGTGSPRMNKVARAILFNYCPFSADIRETIEQNPLYAEILHRYRIRSAQTLHRLEMLYQKIGNSGRSIPDTLADEIEFIKG